MGLIPIFCSILILASSYSPEEVAAILSTEDNAVIILTDTVYGILSKSKKTIEKIKGRFSGQKRIAKLIGGVWGLGENIPEDLRRVANKYWPGALTIVYRDCGYRVPDDEFLLAVLGNMDFVYGSSANKTGERPVESLEEARRIFGEDANIFFVKNGSSGRNSNVASTVFDYDEMRIVREGTIPGEEILSLVRRS